MIFSQYTNVFSLDHGSYGATPRVVWNVFRQWQDLMEFEPVQFLSNNMFKFIRDNIRCLADFVGADPEDIVLVDNATGGVNTVLKSLRYQEGDHIVYLSIEYPAISFTVSHIVNYFNVEATKVEVNVPIDMEKVLQDFEDAITSKTKICVIDHITSSTALILPVARFVEIAHRKGALILIDGAHAIGHVPLNLKELGVDFYTSNCHKWLCSPKGTAFLYVKKEHRNDIVPLTVSHGYNENFTGKFAWTGTKDHSSFLCIKPCIEFRKLIGLENWTNYTYSLVREAYKLLSKKWNTRGVLVEDNDLYIGQFMTILLPSPRKEIPGTTSEKAIYIQDKLFNDYKIEIPLIQLQDKLYVRISAQIYNEISDYEKLGDAILEMFGLEEVEN